MVTTHFDADQMRQIRETARQIMEDMAKQLARVQPMNVDFGSLFIAGAPQEKLIAEGYIPVCPYTRMIWIKKPVNENT